MTPKFMERIQLSTPKIADMGEFKIGMEINTLIQPVENLDDAISKEIIKMCEEKGINDLWLLDKKKIVSALEKQIPKKPSETDKARCIHCACVVKRDERFCKNCGQALDWSDTE